MSQLEWSRIHTGATFEALVAAIVVRRDDGARPFGKPGRDGGIDILSAERDRVYQAKYRSSWSKRQLRDEARKECEKIARYRAPEHTNHRLWAEVDTWYLVTNEQRGLFLEALWQTEVEPAFAELGITAIWWSRDELEAWLQNEAPGLRRAYFSGETRCFLTQTEIAKEHDFNRPILGRDQELAEFNAFLEGDATFLLCHGPGGVGKTRLLGEFGEHALANEMDVWWATEELAHNGRWFEHLIAERSAVIFVDEANPQIVRRLVNQARQRARWKVVATVRAVGDPLRALDPQELPIKPLDRSAARALAIQETKGRVNAEDGDRIAKAADWFPQWIVTACQFLLDGLLLQDLPTASAGIAQLSIERLTRHLGDMRPLLRWIALVQPFNTEDESTLEFLGEVTGSTSRDITLRVDDLVQANVLDERGRLRAIKPDVIHDAILHAWLVDERRPGHVSFDAQDVIRTILKGCNGKRLDIKHALANLTRVEVQSRLRAREPLQLDLLGEIDKTLIEEARGPAVDTRLKVLKLAEQMQSARPLTTVELVRFLRTNPAEPQELKGWMGPRTVDQNTVLNALPQALYGAAGYITSSADQRLLVGEMIALLRVQAKREDLPKTIWFGGKSPGELLPRLIDGESWFFKSYRRPCVAAAIDLLDAMRLGKLQPGDLAVVEILVKRLTAAESQWARWHAETVSITRGLSNSNVMWDTRAQILARLWEDVANTSLSTEERALSWRCLHTAHTAAWRAANEWKDSARAPALFEQIRAELERLATLLQSDTMTPAEKLGATEFWRWYVAYGDEEDRTYVDLAIRCQTLTWQDPTLRDYKLVSTFNDSADPDARAREAAQMLANWQSSERVLTWVEGAYLLAGEEKGSRWLLAPLYHLGGYAPSATVDRIIRGLLASCRQQSSLLASRLFRQPFQALREAGDGVVLVDTVQGLLSAAADDEDRRWFLADLYLTNGVPLCGEYDLVAHGLDTFWADPATRRPLFTCLSRLWQTDPARFVDVADRAWVGLAFKEREGALQAFLQWSFPKPKDVPEEGIARWVLKCLKSVPDLGAFSTPARRGSPANLDRKVERMTRAVLGQLPWQWLSDLLDARLALRSTDDSSSVLARGFAAQELLRPFSEGDAAAAKCIASTIAKASKTDASVYLYGPLLLAELDPNGVAFMPTIVAAIETVADGALSEVQLWARLLSGWGEGSPAWRKGAVAACRWAARQLNMETRRSVWSHLFDGSTGVLMGREAFLNRFASQKDAFQQLFENEDEPDLKEYWRQRVEWAGSGYDAEHRRLEEDEWSDLA